MILRWQFSTIKPKISDSTQRNGIVMAATHVETIRQLALENGQLRDTLNKAEQLHLKETGKSLRASLGLNRLWAPESAKAADVSSGQICFPLKQKPSSGRRFRSTSSPKTQCS